MLASASPLALVCPPDHSARDRNGSREIAQVRTKSARIRATDGDVVEEVLPVVRTMVQQAQAEAGGKMLAYDMVGRDLGETGSWVRKLLGRRAVQVTAATYLNITAVYLDMCARAESAAAARKTDALALKSRADALAQRQASP